MPGLDPIIAHNIMPGCFNYPPQVPGCRANPFPLRGKVSTKTSWEGLPNFLS